MRKLSIFGLVLIILFLSGCSYFDRTLVRFYVDDTLYEEYYVKGYNDITFPNVPTVNDHKFVGWFLDDDYNEQIYAGYPFATLDVKVIRIYGYYEPAHCVTYMAEEKKVYTECALEEYELKYVDGPRLEGRTFIDWYMDDDYEISAKSYFKNIAFDKDYVVYAYYRDSYSPEELLQHFLDSVFYIDIYGRHDIPIMKGSGFFIDHEGTFITNAHVLKVAWSAKISNDNDILDLDVTQVLVYNEEEDYAILRVDPEQYLSDFQPVTFSDSYDKEDVVYALGYADLDEYLKVSEGVIVSNVHYEGQLFIMNTARISHGSSGGALFNAFGEVIGITSVSFDTDLFGAIPVSTFIDELDHLPETGPTIEEFFQGN
jgi:hypothetical protein